MPTARICRPALPALALALLAGALPARASGTGPLLSMINAYRASPEPCNGRRFAPSAALAPHPALASIRITAGTILQSALEGAGYAADHAEAISVSGPPEAESVMALMKVKYCATLLNGRFKSAGAVRRGDNWQVVLAEPTAPLALAPWAETGQALLAAVNRARASARRCGARELPPAAPLAWDGALGRAAIAHSRDMAAKRFLKHQGSDGTMVGERATAAGYTWRTIGENIAVGQRSVEEVMEGWLSSPGHCANIMEARFTQMGAAYAVNGERRMVYWTQAFGVPR